MSEIRDNHESGVKDRNTDLFFQVADVLDLTPELYRQNTWGEFNITEDKALDYDPITAWVTLFGEDEDVPNGLDVRWLKVKECKTTMCVAGHAANLSGWYPVLQEDELDWSFVSEVKDSPHGIDIGDVAGELLGITGDEATALFDGIAEWTGDDLRLMGKGESIVYFDQRDGSDA